MTDAQNPDGTRYIALLRAVNVGGRKVEMARLRTALTAQGFAEVGTYIASGNVFFTVPPGQPADEPALRHRLESTLAAEFGFEIPCILRTCEAFAADIEAAPFRARTPAPDERFTLLFADEPFPGPPHPTSPKGDWEQVGTHDRTAYVIWHLINGRPPTTPVPGPRATTRFLHTCDKILTAARRQGTPTSAS